MPVYNSEPTLVDSLSSLVNQTLSDMELILVNDCSTDGSFNILSDCESQFSDKVLLINLDENHGAGGARNIGLSYASGDYIGFMDSDDIATPDMFEKMYTKAISGNYDIVDCGYYNEATETAIVHASDELTGTLNGYKRSKLIASGGYLGNKDINLMASMRNVNYNYLYDEEGYVIEIREGNNKYIISYGETIPSNPDPTPSNPTTDEELEGAIGDAPEGSEDSPTEIFIPSDGITLEKPLDINKHIRLKGGKLIRSNDNPYAMLRIRSGYSLELEDITIDGNVLRQKDGTLIVYGKLKLKDGVSIKNCYRTEADSPSGAICVAQGGVLTMNGGTISGNTGAYGSAVYNEGTFTMADGEISANSGQIGTVVNNAGGEFIMTGGRISSNKVTDGCGGVFVSDNCTFTMTGGEISGNEDCDLYTWSDLQIGGPAKVTGLTLLNDGNSLLVNPALRNNWQISYVDTPPAGTIVATGRNGYRLAATDLQKIIYYNNVCQLKLSGNNIVTYQTGTGIDEINAVSFHLSVSDNQILVEGLPARTSFTIYEIGGRAVSTHITDNSGQCNFSLESGIYLLNCKDQTKKFLVK